VETDPLKFTILTFGCRVNHADSLALENGLRASGAEPVRSADADVIIVNSCSVTCTADQGTRQAVRRAARENPGARIVVTGCYATRRPEEISALPGVVRVVPNALKDDLATTLAREYLPLEWSTRDRYAPDGEGPCGLRLTPGAAGRTAFTLRVQTGCDERCSYCIIPSTRGASRSRPIDDVLGTVEQACAAGYREITLTGVHLGAYGRDLAPARSLADLLEPLVALRHDVLFRLGSLEPMDCTPRVLDVVAGSQRFARAFHLPLQHASARMLAAMRRPYSVDFYADLVRTIRRRLPDAAIGSDVIVGFPGESLEDFDALCTWLASSPLTQLHVFPYSDRPGTEASRLGHRVEGGVVRERAARVREIGRLLTSRFVEAQRGAVARALVVDDGTWAVTGNGLKVRLNEIRQRNEWVHVRLSESAGMVTGALLTA
jgi:threonylcarbamoyladenosine tRNA methylthiotransferase MtaB